MNSGSLEPSTASRTYNEFIQRYELHMLKEPADLVLVDGNLAFTKDLDLQLGDQAYSALYRLAQHWRHSEAHFASMFQHVDLMVDRHADAKKRLEIASDLDARRPRDGSSIQPSPEFLEAWHAHFDEEGSAAFGQVIYSGCIIMLASNALLRFYDDLDRPKAPWHECGPAFGGHSIGEIVVASANGFRHADEWWKTRPPKEQQLRSQTVLASALGPRGPRTSETVQPGRCHEVLELIGRDDGCNGFSAAVLQFAQEISMRVRSLGIDSRKSFEV